MLFLSIYGACLLALLPRLSLWLDEVLTLIGSVQPNLIALIEYLHTVPGGTLFAFLPQTWVIDVLGYSSFAARLPSALASLVACAGVFVLARRFGLRWPLLAVAIFALLPLQFRYAMEARPYAPALALTVWSSVVFFKLLDRPDSWALAALYTAINAVSVHALAFAIFVPSIHVLYLILRRQWREDARLLAITCSSVILAFASLVPWYLLMRQDWSQTRAEMRDHVSLNFRSILMILREITGAGYIGTVVLFTGVFFGVRRKPDPFWILYALGPLGLVLIGDVVMDYFLAIRQMIYILVPLSILFAVGIEAMERNARWLLIAAVAVFLVGDALWILRPREDWQSAADLIQSHVAEGACVIFTPRDAEPLYEFFHPQLVHAKCRPDVALGDVVMAVNPYDPAGLIPIVQDQLSARGFELAERKDFHGPRVELYEGH